LRSLLAWHREHYPLWESRDAVKLIFQAMLGCGHLLGSAEQVAARIAGEMASLSPRADEPLIEPAGPRYMRVNLRRAMHEGIRPEWLARMMIHSQPPLATRAEAAEMVRTLLADEASLLLAQRLVEEPDWLPSHTPAYHSAYHPAYRIISRDWLCALQALCHVAQHWHKPRMLILIDGPCGSGKSTLAARLHTVLDAAVVPMDDFFTPHGQKTPERLAMPGGNADWERVCSEFLTPWLQGKSVSYRPYDCQNDVFAPAVAVPASHVTILEGSYSMMPDIARHADVRLFLRISPKEQCERILQRNGETMLLMFQQRWIPLEQAYFSAFGLPDAACCVLDDDQEV